MELGIQRAPMTNIQMKYYLINVYVYRTVSLYIRCLIFENIYNLICSHIVIEDSFSEITNTGLKRIRYCQIC